jgi:Mrp family chromosome partitioning ATPase
VIRGRASLRDTLIATSIENVSVVPAGFATPRSEKVFSAGTLGPVLSELGDAADVVLLDAPPVLEDADTLTLASLADGVLLIADASRTTAISVYESTRHLRLVDVRVLGAILVNADRARQPSTSRTGRRTTGPRTDDRRRTEAERRTAEGLGLERRGSSDEEPVPVREMFRHG